jgi:aminoglycoside phosphotransferase (APT) family kinase protein
MPATTSPIVDLSAPELARVAAYLQVKGVDLTGPLTAKLLAGGRSNLTYLLGDARTRWVLRTPPRAGRTPSAHDVAREHTVTSALGATAVPVPAAVAMCPDESVIGAPFAISAFVDGVAVRTQADLALLSDIQLDTVVGAMVTALADLHRVDHAAVGLAGFGRTDGYAARQLRRWSGQWDIVGSDEHRDAAARLVEGLGASMPEQRSSAIVHGDFRIDNTLLSLDPVNEERSGVAAIVDWELSTIGDPVADVAMMCAYRDPAFDLIIGEPSAWTSPRMPAVSGLVERYAAAGGAPLEHWAFHLALAYFKVGVIAAGIGHRYTQGAGGGPGFDSAGESVERYFDLANDALRDIQ